MSDTAPLGLPILRDGEINPLGIVGTDFLTYAIGSGANISSQEDYYYDPQRPTGALPGLARSTFHNKATRQGTFVAHSLSLWISQQLVTYVYDDGNDIAWIGLYSSALAQFITAMLPDPGGGGGGAFLPLAGGTMLGHISFNPGVSTLMGNGTWYYGRDTAGTARGLIVKASDNQIYINDGSSTQVNISGTPIVLNNTWWSGRHTNGNVFPIIGLLSDNYVHISSPNIYLDTYVGGAVWVTNGGQVGGGNVVIPNASFYYGVDTGGSARALLGLSAGNGLLLGSGITGQTDIYAGSGQYIFLHNNTNALGQLAVNQYTYLNGGGRAYIAGGNDPFQIYADPGFYPRIQYVVSGTRVWTAGLSSSGIYTVADETALLTRFVIDLNGAGYFYQNLWVTGQFGADSIYADHGLGIDGSATITGGLAVYDSLYVATGNLTVNNYSYLSGGASTGPLTVSGQTAINNTLTVQGGVVVYNGINVASGGLTVIGSIVGYSAASIAGTLSVGSASGGQVFIGACSPLYDAGSNYLTTAGNFQVYQGTIIGFNLTVHNNVSVGGQISCTGVLNTGSSLFVSGNASFSSGVTIAGPATAYDLSVIGLLHSNSYVNCLQYRIQNIPFAHFGTEGAITVMNGSGLPALTLYNTGYNYYTNNLHVFQNLGGGVTWAQFNGGVTYNVEGIWRQFSGSDIKRDIEPYQRGLAAIQRLQPVSFRYRDDAPLRHEDPDTMLYGLVAEEVERVAPEMVGSAKVGQDERSHATVAPGMLVYLLCNAVKELAARLEALEGKPA